MTMSLIVNLEEPRYGIPFCGFHPIEIDTKSLKFERDDTRSIRILTHDEILVNKERFSKQYEL